MGQGEDCAQNEHTAEERSLGYKAIRGQACVARLGASRTPQAFSCKSEASKDTQGKKRDEVPVAFAVTLGQVGIMQGCLAPFSLPCRFSSLSRRPHLQALQGTPANISMVRLPRVTHMVFPGGKSPARPRPLSPGEGLVAMGTPSLSETPASGRRPTMHCAPDALEPSDWLSAGELPQSPRRAAVVRRSLQAQKLLWVGSCAGAMQRVCCTDSLRLFPPQGGRGERGHLASNPPVPC